MRQRALVDIVVSLQVENLEASPVINQNFNISIICNPGDCDRRGLIVSRCETCHPPQQILHFGQTSCKYFLTTH